MSGIKRRDPPPRCKRRVEDDRPNIDFTKEEFDRLTEAMKKEEFRKLFLEYMDEMQDPENRKKYEEEFRMFEAERGVDVKFVNPEPGFVIKTSQNGNKKCFINCAQNPLVAKPSNEACLHPETGEKGLTWAIPIAQSHPREDLDNKNKRCQVYDVIFHPDAIYMAEKNKCFRKCIIDTALDAVEREFEVKLDRINLKYPKLKFKGLSRPAVIRTLMKEVDPENAEPHPLEHIFPPKPTAEAVQPKVIPLKELPKKSSEGGAGGKPAPEYCVPRYTIKYRRGVDLSEYTNELDAKLNLTKPKELSVEIDLPLLKSSAECELDVTEQTLYLVSDKPGAKYRLNLELPHKVLEKQGRARFDTDTRLLIVTLPVAQDDVKKQTEMHQSLLHLSREDSGVESDIRDEQLVSETPLTSPLVEELPTKTEDSCNVSPCSESNTTPSNLDLGKPDDKFLSDDLDYQLPAKFDYNVFDRTLSWILHVRNVQNDSLAIRQIQGQALHLKFTSIGAGYYPAHYAFYIQLGKGTASDEEAFDLAIVNSDVEAWENNVVLNVHLNTAGDQLKSYLAGRDADSLVEYSTQCKVSSERRQSRLRTKHSTDSDDDDDDAANDGDGNGAGDTREVHLKATTEKETAVKETKEALTVNTDSGICLNETSHGNAVVKETTEKLDPVSKKLSKKQRRKNKNYRRSLSESACDELEAAFEDQQQQQGRLQKRKAEVAKGVENGNNECSSPEPDEPIQSRSPRMVVTTSASLDVPKLKGGCSACNGNEPVVAPKQRSLSESRDSIVSGGSMTSSSNTSSSYKGILKHYSHYDPRPSISDSCSSIDDYSSTMTSACCSMERTLCHMLDGSLRFSQSFSDIPEENCTGATTSSISIGPNGSNSAGVGVGTLALSESQKKTVRFSEVIRKQVFRMDSSILGQRKKNQKRRDRKMRALQRRLSEGDSVDYEDDKHQTNVELNQSSFYNRNNDSIADFHDSMKSRRKCNKSPSSSTANRMDSESSSDVDVTRNTLMFDMDM